MNGRTIAILLGLSLPLLAWAVGAGDEGRSFSIYPPQQIPLHFDHALHLEQDMKCTDCHDVENSRHVGDRSLPPESTCSSCHDTDKDCQMCHQGFDPTAMVKPRPVVVPTAHLKFDHQVHLERNVPCATCHGSFEKVGLATRAQLPKMETCLECHREGGDASGACSVCHLTEAGGGLQRLLPGGARLIPEAGNPFGVHHGPGYQWSHGDDARNARQVCASCHGMDECLACHDGAIKSLRVHPNDWLSLHAVVSKHRPMECSSCHNQQDLCVTCHERVGIGPQADPALRARNLAVHPPGWVGSPGEKNLHGVWASRNIESCVSCHREEGCIQCHATKRRQGHGHNPHPPGFRKQACGIFQSNARVCLKCHSPTDAALARCL